MAENKISAEQFAYLVTMKFCSDCVETSQDNCGIIQTEQMKKVFIAQLEDIKYEDVTEKMINDFNRELDDFRKDFPKRREEGEQK